MRNVAIVSYAQTPFVRSERRRNEVEMLMPVVSQAIERSGIPKQEIGFTCSGSSDYIAGQSFSNPCLVPALANALLNPVCQSRMVPPVSKVRAFTSFRLITKVLLSN